MVLLAAAMKNMQEPYDKNVGLNSNKGAWSPEEDQKLISYIMKYRIWNWNQIPKFAGLSRTGKSCRLRWVNYLRPDLKRGPFSMEEVETIIRMYQSLGNRWSAISKELPGRTDNEIKNFFHTHLKKQFGTKVNDHVQVKRKASCKKSKKAKELEMRTRGETQEKPNQSLDMSSSDITFDENHNWDFTNFSETSSEDNYCTVNSLVNQEAVPIIDSMVILESNPTTSENHDLYVQDFMDETGINSSNVDFWLELYMAAENLAG